MDPVLSTVAMVNASKVGFPRMNSMVTFKSPADLWSENWFGLVVEFLTFGLFIHACSHAARRGEKVVYLLVTLMVAATGIEILQQIPHEGYQLWWYHESTLNLFQHKVPLYILCLFSLVYYWVDYSMKDLDLPIMTKSLATGAASMSIAFPLLRLAPNYLLMMVHFDDPVFKDRLYNVSFSEMTYLFLLFFHVGQLYNGFYDEIEVPERQFFRLLRCSLQSGMVSAIYSLLEFYLLYVFFKLIFHFNSGICFVAAFIIIGFLAKGEIAEKVQEISTHDISFVLKKKEWLYLITFLLIVSFLPVMVHPEDMKSNGVRLEYGPCHVKHAVSNMSPLDSFRSRYICPNDTVQYGFDFHCVPERDILSTRVKKQYTICGAAFEDPVQTCKSLIGYSVACSGIFYTLFSLNVRLHEIPAETKKVN